MQTATKLFFIFVIISLSHIRAMTTEDAKQLVTGAVNAAKNQPFFPVIEEPDTIGDLESLGEFQLLKSKAEDVWKTMSDNLYALNIVAPTKEAKIILFQSFEGLSPESYLDFINKALGYYQLKLIDKNQFDGLIFLPQNNQRWFLSHNYQDPRVHRFLLRVKAVFANDQNTIDGVDHILSGRMQRADDAERAADPYFKGNEGIPLLRSGTSASPTP
jgi:hypothetical protein